MQFLVLIYNVLLVKCTRLKKIDRGNQQMLCVTIAELNDMISVTYGWHNFVVNRVAIFTDFYHTIVHYRLSQHLSAHNSWQRYREFCQLRSESFDRTKCFILAAAPIIIDSIIYIQITVLKQDCNNPVLLFSLYISAIYGALKIVSWNVSNC